MFLSSYFLTLTESIFSLSNTTPKIRSEALRIAFSSRNPISTTFQTSDNSYFTREAFNNCFFHSLIIFLSPVQNCSSSKIHALCCMLLRNISDICP